MHSTNPISIPNPEKLTPMMAQWLAQKQKAKDAILLFRMGDFYELFDSDAERAAPILDLTLTSRDKGKENAMKMAGFPFHAAPLYIAKLVAQGFKVAICDQMEDPKLKKTIVKREITRIVTPGTVIDEEQILNPKTPNFLAALAWTNKNYALCFVDISTNELFVTQSRNEVLLADEIIRKNPKELLVAQKDATAQNFLERFALAQKMSCRVELRQPEENNLPPHGQLPRWFTQNENAAGLSSYSLVVSYIHDTQRALAHTLMPPQVYELEQSLLMDSTTRRHLNIFDVKGEVKVLGTLHHLIDKTKTAMGGRILFNWLLAPSVDEKEIIQRHEAVEEFIQKPSIMHGLTALFAQVHDIERILSKASVFRVSPRDLGNLRDTLALLPAIKKILCSSSVERIATLHASINMLTSLHLKLDGALNDSLPGSVKDGGFFRKGFDSTLDDFLRLAGGAREEIIAIEQQERERSGISTLKIKYTGVFGFYIEITKSNLSKVPSGYVRKQTVANAERFVTAELAQLEERILSAEHQARERELMLFNDLITQVTQERHELITSARAIAELDTLLSFAIVSEERHFCRPHMLPMQAQSMTLQQSRHPIIEILCEREGVAYVPNNIALNSNDHQILLITGPNMAGKSSVMRQVALTQLLAQVGCFVPALSAELSICDRLFARVGASDDLMFGQSTFMVEMQETAHILHNATPNSLVIFDEIGRGTSTFDGLSIAWAVVEYMHNVIKARTLFSTHYHELAQVPESLDKIKNVHVGVAQEGQVIKFLYLLREGAAEQSYGISVAALAGLPSSLIVRANAVLESLESKPRGLNHIEKKPSRNRIQNQLGLFIVN